MRHPFDSNGQWNGNSIGSGGDDGLDDHPTQRRFRAVFISDLHLGTAGCQAGALLDFLKSHHSDTLYLVGDIADGWQLRRKWYWPQSHNDVLQKLLKRARKGCRIVFIPGNHDEFARQFAGLHFGGIEVATQAVHVTAQGRSLWIVHGDYFDAVVRSAKWLACLGDNLYELTLRLNRHLNGCVGTWVCRTGPCRLTSSSASSPR